MGIKWDRQFWKNRYLQFCRFIIFAILIIAACICIFSERLAQDVASIWVMLSGQPDYFHKALYIKPWLQGGALLCFALSVLILVLIR